MKDFNLLFLYILMFIVKIVISQDQILFREDDQIETEHHVHPNSFYSIQIPEKLLIQMRDIQNTSEFIERFVHRDESLESPTDADEDEFLLNGRRTASTATPSIAKPAICQPEPKVVELTKPQIGTTFYWPSCVRVQRCGGCCTSKALACNPIETSLINITVLKLKFDPRKPDAFESDGMQTFSLEQHDRCACDCAIKPQACPVRKIYRQEECRCVCADPYQASSCAQVGKYWDSSVCHCKCWQIKECSTGKVFNPYACRCEELHNLTTTEDP